VDDAPTQFNEVRCPRCGAEPGKGCRTKTGNDYKESHGVRKRAFYAERDAWHRSAQEPRVKVPEPKAEPEVKEATAEPVKCLPRRSHRRIPLSEEEHGINKALWLIRESGGVKNAERFLRAAALALKEAKK